MLNPIAHLLSMQTSGNVSVVIDAVAGAVAAMDNVTAATSLLLQSLNATIGLDGPRRLATGSFDGVLPLTTAVGASISAVPRCPCAWRVAMPSL